MSGRGKSKAPAAKTVRYGRQTPTSSVALPYTRTQGQDAVELYNRSGRTARPWQELLVYDILALNDDGLYVQKTGDGSLSSSDSGPSPVLPVLVYFRRASHEPSPLMASYRQGWRAFFHSSESDESQARPHSRKRLKISVRK